ncbi:uncharacterized protein YecT (DUF1311 family) [Rhodoblastus acidophilus]|uniref:lysozyme inhibitor LprI family protein n=1 Tax=Rhodoblastus acidophilus TaxID=1074 RepID=UPI002224B962|nr:hypothetical protein [Rhodoblastus acidophilus]MCW2283137.1 uncharacterized protein YecT (DUF1311 family) [Rhodoblastus acidophilus]MCW2331812.1 uncharacterized protein YecT (DUF1311 family) [Rhodoblastus acidophilus]
MKTAALLILLAAVAQSAQAASFDCGKARTPLERRICADPALGKADEDLAKAYAETLRTFVIPDVIKDSQRAWLFEAPQCLENSSCVALFQERAETLRLYRTAKVYTDYGKAFDREKTTLLVYERGGKPWLDWYGDWMPDAYRPKPFPDGFLARDSGELIPAKNGKFTLADHDDAVISLSDGKVTFGGEYGMNLSARQGFIHGDFPRVR